MILNSSFCKWCLGYSGMVCLGGIFSSAVEEVNVYSYSSPHDIHKFIHKCSSCDNFSSRKIELSVCSVLGP